MADSASGRALHAKAEVARESGKFLDALKYTDEASLAYQKDGDYLGLAEVQSSRQSTFKHLYRKTGDKYYLILEKHSAQASVEVAEKSKIKEALAIPYHNLGKYYQEAKEYEKAAEYFKKAVKHFTSYPPKRHNRPAVIADICGHLSAAEYLGGDKTALARALKALEDLKISKEDSYNKNVWLSGAHLRIAEMLMIDSPKLAKLHLIEAEKIIKSDKRLVLRKNQLAELRKKLLRDFMS